MKFVPETIGDVVLVHAKASYGTVIAAAEAWGVSKSMLFQIVHGERRPNESVLQAIGYRQVEVWIPVGAELPSIALPMRSTRPASGVNSSADSEVEGDARVIQFMRILHSQVPEEQQPKGRSDFSDEQWGRACAAYEYARGVPGAPKTSDGGM